ncbi:hypothetical protein LTR08_006543 [Meristemomyces frigidus]|nr:hypothetical protein LTR08_006543 [Meristemomyces frigidus]
MMASENQYGALDDPDDSRVVAGQGKRYARNRNYRESRKARKALAAQAPAAMPSSQPAASGGAQVGGAAVFLTGLQTKFVNGWDSLSKSMSDRILQVQQGYIAASASVWDSTDKMVFACHESYATVREVVWELVCRSPLWRKHAKASTTVAGGNDNPGDVTGHAESIEQAPVTAFAEAPLVTFVRSSSPSSWPSLPMHWARGLQLWARRTWGTPDGLSVSIHELSATIRDLAEQVGTVNTQSQHPEIQNPPSKTPNLWNAEMNTIHTSEATIGRELQARKGGEPMPDVLSDELREKLHVFAAAVSRRPPHERYVTAMADTIWLAVHRAEHFWTRSEPLPSIQGLVPQSTVLGEALRHDSVAWQAKTSCRVAGGQIPTNAHKDGVEEHLTKFLERAVKAGKHTELAHLAFLLWSDEAIHHVLTLDDMREKIHLAFGSWAGVPGVFYARPALTLESLPRLADVDFIWRDHLENEVYAGIPRLFQ